MTLDEFRTMALALPEVEEGVAYGTPIWKVGKRMLTRVWEDDQVVLKMGQAQRAALVAARPDIYLITDHHRDHDLGVARLSAADPEEVEEILRDTWKAIAPKRLLKTFIEDERRGL